MTLGSLEEKVLVTGATGFIGRRLIPYLSNEGHEYSCVSVVRDLSQIQGTIDGYVIEQQFADITADILLSVSCIIHTAAVVHQMNGAAKDVYQKVNVEDTLRLAKKAAKAGVKRFIFISSIKVNGETTDGRLPFSADDLVEIPTDPYARSKYDAEQALLQLGRSSGLEVVIIRPPLVYGRGVKANFASMLRWTRKGIPLPLGAIKNKRSMVYVDNLCSLIAKCIEHPDAVGQVFLVSDDYDVSTTELLQEIARAQRVQSRLVSVPEWLLKLAALCLGKKAVGRRLCGSLQVDITKTKNMLDWSPHITPAQGLVQTVSDDIT